MDTGIHAEAKEIKKETIREVKDAILEIMNVSCFKANTEVKRTAIIALTGMCKVGNVALNNCSVTGK